MTVKELLAALTEQVEKTGYDDDTEVVFTLNGEPECWEIVPAETAVERLDIDVDEGRNVVYISFDLSERFGKFLNSVSFDKRLECLRELYKVIDRHFHDVKPFVYGDHP